MVAVGYSLLCEQSGPKDLVDYAVRAEEVGFDQITISDHYYPWLDAQGHSPHAWSVLGAVAHATSRAELMTYITCPTRRYHPTVVAQQAATVHLLADGRFVLGLGAGENLNEHVVGPWPHVRERHAMLAEALEIIRPLLDGENLTYSGEYFEVPEAYVWDRSETRVPIAVALSGPESAGIAGEYGDGAIATQPQARLLRLFDDAGGSGKPRYGQQPICWGPDEAACRKIAHEQFPWFGLGWKVNSNLPNPAAFADVSQFVREEDVAAGIPCGPDTSRHVEAIAKFAEVGFTHVSVLQIGDESQREFFDWAETELIPALRRL
ncbi:LLM class F420-dependent oxidoreductase [Asanoa ishikariensis]|uniref:F420-dependent oxidoreductase, G6PDH family n=1 Tax=Asanoa ishikariensis TaxID=137265 RepID=A0A1H3RYK2_9ACTN|nr:TIGR03557 family F420-dependent LLM class oxidoreductase [Asanoa ishikariensis]GIF66687.1 LLM class F420-dependent oxidoreductase [Asanoa ishikariensis]SDZ30710.1 F420-dependent oxidoreductase, G6PDH family [Asanoa ishikariensis]